VQECAEAIERKCHQKIATASSLAKTIASLERHEFEALVIDESILQMDNGAEPAIFARAGTAMPIYVNLALHGAERVAGEVLLGLQRLTRERATSLRAVSNELRNQLGSDVTAILLNAELGLQDKSLAPDISGKLGTVQAIAQRIRQKLDGKPVEGPSSKAGRKKSATNFHGLHG
jgi:hypothetical protein